MHFRRVLWTCLSLALTVTLTSCQRSTGQFVDDAKTAGRYSARAFSAMGGKHGESRQVASEEAFGWEYFQGDEAGALMNHSSALDDPYDQYRAQSSDLKSIESIPYSHFKAPGKEIAEHFKTIYFDTNDDVIRGQKNIASVGALAEFMKLNNELLIYVEGHCDKRGTASYNLALGARRASSIRKLLIEQGVEAGRLRTISFGKERPAAEGNDESAWKLNRRGEYRILFQ